MSLPNIDTFEHDISEEIKSKEASISDIASASGDIGNTPPQATASRTLLVAGALGIALVLAIVAAFLMVRGDREVGGTVPVPEPSTSENVSRISPTLEGAIGQHIARVQASEYGYALLLRSYTPVFGYMLKNEDAFADELAQAVASPRELGTSTVPFSWSDATVSNENMRVGVSGSSTIVYAFINANALLISSTTAGILSLRGAILSQ